MNSPASHRGSNLTGDVLGDHDSFTTRCDHQLIPGTCCPTSSITENERCRITRHAPALPLHVVLLAAGLALGGMQYGAARSPGEHVHAPLLIDHRRRVTGHVLGDTAGWAARAGDELM